MVKHWAGEIAQQIKPSVLHTGALVPYNHQKHQQPLSTKLEAPLQQALMGVGEKTDTWKLTS